MRNKIYLIGLALWLALCIVGPAYDASTLAERTASILAATEEVNHE